MKRKNIIEKSKIVSEEGSSDDSEQMEEDDLEGDAVVNNGEDGEENNINTTDSDDESDIDYDCAGDGEVKATKSKSEKVKDIILQRYQERHGKQLYIRFPHKVPETQEALEEKVRELTPLVVKVHKPRQRHARFCLVDFPTKEDRDLVLSKLKKSAKNGALKKYVFNIPRTENDDFVKELTERKVKSIEKQKDKQRLKKASKKSLAEKNFTSTVIVLNLPKKVSKLQIRELFENAVDINIKSGKAKLNKEKNSAAVTFPTTMDARIAVKNKLSLGGNELVIKFDNKNLKRVKNSSKNSPKKALNDSRTKSRVKT